MGAILRIFVALFVVSAFITTLLGALGFHKLKRAFSKPLDRPEDDRHQQPGGGHAGGPVIEGEYKVLDEK